MNDKNVLFMNSGLAIAGRELKFTMRVSPSLDHIMSIIIAEGKDEVSSCMRQPDLK